MSQEENLSIVKAIYEAFGQGDVDAILERVTNDVDWATDGAGSEAPWYGPWSGKDGVKSFFQGIGEAAEVKEFTLRGIAANDNHEVFVLLRFGFTSSATGREATMNLHHYFRFRDGKVEYYRGSEDTAQTARALAA